VAVCLFRRCSSRFSQMVWSYSTWFFTIAPKDVIAFYERELKQSGFRINAAATSDSGTSSGGLVSGDDASNKRTVLVTVGNDKNSTNVSVTYSQK